MTPASDLSLDALPPDMMDRLQEIRAGLDAHELQLQQYEQMQLPAANLMDAAHAEASSLAAAPMPEPVSLPEPVVMPATAPASPLPELVQAPPPKTAPPRETAAERFIRMAEELPEGMALLTTVPPPLPKKSLNWHYALNDQTYGPVKEAELVQLLNDGTLNLTSLVWNKTMKEWTPASATVLAEKVGGAPPPLPGAQPTPRAAGNCPQCGVRILASDRFCPECGRPLKS